MERELTSQRKSSNGGLGPNTTMDGVNTVGNRNGVNISVQPLERIAQTKEFQPIIDANEI